MESRGKSFERMRIRISRGHLVVESRLLQCGFALLMPWPYARMRSFYHARKKMEWFRDRPIVLLFGILVVATVSLNQQFNMPARQS